MTSNRLPTRPNDYSSVAAIDRLALSRAQHFQSRENRPKSVSEDELDAVSEWSDSDQECCPLSDFETTIIEDLHPESTYLPTTLPIISDSTTSTRISFAYENEKPKQEEDEDEDEEELISKPPISSNQISRKSSQAPLLPGRRSQTKPLLIRRPSTRSTTHSQLSYSSRTRKTASPSPARLYLRRETTSTTISTTTHLTKDSTLSLNSSSQSHDDHSHQRQIISPNFSQTSAVPRVYEIKKIFVDDYDYGRLTDLPTTKPSRPCSRQKWGTIVHPPFPLGYQHIAPEQVNQAVERLSSPVRCRDRHTPLQTPSKRYLSVEETEALINRLTKVKTIRSPEQYWPMQRPSRSVKTLNNNWKGVGISA